MVLTMKKKSAVDYAFLMRLIEELASIIKLALWVFCLCYLGFWFFRMLAEVAQAKEGAIRAIAVVVEKFSLDRIILIFTNVITGLGWGRSRSRNKHLTKKIGELRHKLEENDSVNDRSGLDKYGRIKGE